jgi:hypothetical protein
LKCHPRSFIHACADGHADGHDGHADGYADGYARDQWIEPRTVGIADLGRVATLLL